MPAIKWTVVLIDDDAGCTRLYRQGLETFSSYANRLEILEHETVDPAYRLANQRVQDARPILWIVDCMMPFFENEQDSGYEGFTGIELMHRIQLLRREHLQLHWMMTNVTTSAVAAAIASYRSDLLEVVKLLEKAEWSPMKLAALVDETILKFESEPVLQ